MKEEHGIGIILHDTVFKDYDSILDIMTETHGRRSILAKGVRRAQSRNKGHIRKGALISYEIFLPKTEGLSRLKKLGTVQAFLSEDIWEQSRMAMLCDIIRSCLPDSHQAEFLFPMWKNLLEQISFHENFFFWAVITLLHKEGFLPHIPNNLSYQSTFFLESTGECFASPQKRSNEHDFRKISVRNFKILRFFQNIPSPSLSETQKLILSSSDWFELWEIIWWIIDQHTDSSLRSKKIYEQLLKT